MKEGSRRSKRSETPGPATSCVRIPEGCQEGARACGLRFWHPVPGCTTLLRQTGGRSDAATPGYLLTTLRVAQLQRG